LVPEVLEEQAETAVKDVQVFLLLQTEEKLAEEVLTQVRTHQEETVVRLQLAIHQVS
jgi:hypothetical protein